MSTDQTPAAARRNPGGRPRIDPDQQQSVRVTIRLSSAQAERLEALGGAKWLRAQLDAAGRSVDLAAQD